MPQFRKKPIVIEAFQMTEERRKSNAEWPNWMHEAWNGRRGEAGTLQVFSGDDGRGFERLSVMTLEGEMLIGWGDWIIRGVKGEIYPCKPDIFAATYDPVP